MKDPELEPVVEPVVKLLDEELPLFEELYELIYFEYPFVSGAQSYV